MNILIIGVGGIGTFYGLKLEDLGHDLTYIARGESLEYLKNNTLKLTHPDFIIEKKVNALSIEELIQKDASSYDLIFVTTKSFSTRSIAITLSSWFKGKAKIPYIISLQNGVENENILCEYINEEHIIGGITRLIAAHVIKKGHIDSTGSVETVLGAIKHTVENKEFLEMFCKVLDKTNTKTIISQNIILELWKKLIINNGVSAICALLEEKSGTLIKDEKTSKIVYGLMSETAIAAKALHLDITQVDVDEMFELMKNFDSIKPSMWIDKMNNRDLELEFICGTVIKYNDLQGIDSPYTRCVSTILEYTYNKHRKN